MSRLIVLISILLLLTGCITTPDFDTGAGCWRYGVSENGNTGRMTAEDIQSIPVVKLGYDALLEACGVVDDRTLAGQYMDGRSMALRACFKPREVDGKTGQDIIYSYNLNWGGNNYYVAHERCHAYWGRKHNSCNGKGYAQWGNSIKSACNWDKT